MNQTLKRNSRQRKNLKTKDDEEKVDGKKVDEEEFDEEYVDEVSDKDEEPHKEINNSDSVILSAVFWNLSVLQYSWIVVIVEWLPIALR